MTEIVKIIANDPRLEMEWVDLLSQLEYVGCRKIVRSQPFDRIDLNLLQHIAEEASHAFLMKKLAEDLGVEKGRSWGGGRFSAIGWNYFQSLDRQVSEVVPGESLQYPSVSWIIERRVLTVYPYYMKITKDGRVREILEQILSQEKRHARQFDAWEIPASSKAAVVLIEEALWARFLKDISAEIIKTA